MLRSAGVFTVPIIRRSLFSVKYETERDFTRITLEKRRCALNYIRLSMRQQVSTNVLHSIRLSKRLPVTGKTSSPQRGESQSGVNGLHHRWTLSVENYVAILVSSSESTMQVNHHQTSMHNSDLSLNCFRRELKRFYFSRRTRDGRRL